MNGTQDLPITIVGSAFNFRPLETPGWSRYRHTLPTGEHLDALLLNKESDTLVVTFHGALDRSKFSIPRFERVRSTTEHDVSALFLADPALWRAPHLQLAWYLGWEGFNTYEVLADWSVSAGRAVGARRVVFSGSSGGGFAALQVARHVPRSLVLPFNPQTSIHGYKVGGHSFSAQREYIAALRPDLAPDGVWRIDWSYDWTAPLGDDFSAIRSYSRPVEVDVLYASNTNDFHHEQHYVPFADAIGKAGGEQRLHPHFYSGAVGHTPPRPDEFHTAMVRALELVARFPTAI